MVSRGNSARAQLFNSLEELTGSPDERRAILHSYIEPTEKDREEGRKVPTAAHRAIAELVRRGYIKVIVTTNFDRLTETALREIGVEPTVVASVDALSGAEAIAHSVCYILKLHGDYKDARILNTDAELSAYPTEFDLLLDRIFDEYGLIVCGWSGKWDHALRRAFLRAPSRRYPIYWTARGQLASEAQDLVNRARALSQLQMPTPFSQTCFGEGGPRRHPAPKPPKHRATRQQRQALSLQVRISHPTR